MSNYTKTTNFASKDNLSPGNPLKIVKGTEIDTEFNNIQTAVATKTDNSAAAITGGTITGITDLAVADGGTGASTANAALNNLLPSQASASGKYLKSNGTDASWDQLDISTADITGTLPVANGGTGVTTSTGTGAVVLSNSPTLVTPALGTPSSGTATNLTGLPISTGVSGLGTGVATFLGTPSSANLASAVTDETGSGALVFANSPTLVTPALGTPSSATLTNATGLPISTGVSGLGTGVASFLATPSSANLATAVSDETGSGALVFANSPTLVTPALGTPSSATLTNATGLPIATGVSGLGTGVATALAVNVGSSGAPVVNGGALGTPSSGTATNLTGLPLSTGVTGTLPVANGGTGQTSYTDGQLLIGNSTGNTLTKATLTAGSGISVTNAGGSITIAATGGGGSGDVVGPSSATANGVALFDGTTGKLLKNSSATDGLLHGLTVGRGAGAVSTNTAVGASALAANTTGSSNTAVGSEALLVNTTASNNTAVGILALSASNGGNNTAIGDRAMLTNTSGSENTALGRSTLRLNTTGASNTGLGYNALYSNTTASNNTAVGYQSLYTQSTGSTLNNTAIGYQSGYSITTGTNNTAVGYIAGKAITTGNYNVSVGRLSMDNSAGVTGDENTAIGNGTMRVLTSGANNTAVGSGALGSNTTANNNTAVGYQAGYSGTTAASNVYIGRQAGYTTTTGSENTAVGDVAFYLNTTGGSNVALGRLALYSNTTANNNTAVGYQAGYATTTGANNLFLGYQAGYATTTGYQCTALGANSLKANVTNLNCVAVGYEALLASTGNSNTALGKGAGSAITTGYGHTIIGAYSGNQGGLDIRTASNRIVLSDGDGNPQANCTDGGTWTLGMGTKSGDGLVVFNAQQSTNYGPALLGRTGSLGSTTTRWYIGSDSWVKGGTDYDAVTIASGAAASGGVKLTSGATSWVSASDARLKTVTGSYDNALSDISQIQAVKFTWKHDAENKSCVGVIAQSVEAVVPEAVERLRNSKEDETEYLGVRYTELIPLMIASIQALKAEIDTLKGN